MMQRCRFSATTLSRNNSGNHAHGPDKKGLLASVDLLSPPAPIEAKPPWPSVVWEQTPAGP